MRMINKVLATNFFFWYSVEANEANETIINWSDDKYVAEILEVWLK